MERSYKKSYLVSEHLMDKMVQCKCSSGDNVQENTIPQYNNISSYTNNTTPMASYGVGRVQMNDDNGSPTTTINLNLSGKGDGGVSMGGEQKPNGEGEGQISDNVNENISTVSQSPDNIINQPVESDQSGINRSIEHESMNNNRFLPSDTISMNVPSNQSNHEPPQNEKKGIILNYPEGIKKMEPELSKSVSMRDDSLSQITNSPFDPRVTSTPKNGGVTTNSRQALGKKRKKTRLSKNIFKQSPLQSSDTGDDTKEKPRMKKYKPRIDSSLQRSGVEKNDTNGIQWDSSISRGMNDRSSSASDQSSKSFIIPKPVGNRISRNSLQRFREKKKKGESSASRDRDYNAIQFNSSISRDMNDRSSSGSDQSSRSFVMPTPLGNRISRNKQKMKRKKKVRDGMQWDSSMSRKIDDRPSSSSDQTNSSMIGVHKGTHKVQVHNVDSSMGDSILSKATVKRSNTMNKDSTIGDTILSNVSVDNRNTMNKLENFGENKSLKMNTKRKNMNVSQPYIKKHHKVSDSPINYNPRYDNWRL